MDITETSDISLFWWGLVKGGPTGPPHDKELKPGKNKELRPAPSRPTGAQRAQTLILAVVLAMLMGIFSSTISGCTTFPVGQHRYMAQGIVQDTVTIGPFIVATMLEINQHEICITASGRDTVRDIPLAIPRRCWSWAAPRDTASGGGSQSNRAPRDSLSRRGGIPTDSTEQSSVTPSPRDTIGRSGIDDVDAVAPGDH